MFYEKGTVVETATGNKVSRRGTHLFGSTNIVLSGKVCICLIIAVVVIYGLYT